GSERHERIERYRQQPDNPAPARPQSMNSSGDQYNTPGRYSNASPGGFDNSAAWNRSGATTAPGSELARSTPVTPESSTVASTSPTPAAIPEVSPDTRILSILHIKDQEEIEI